MRPRDNPDTIKFRVGDTVKYEDRYCKIVKIYRFADKENVEMRDRIKLQYIDANDHVQNRDDGNRNRDNGNVRVNDEHEAFECDYDDDSSIMLIKKNIHFIETTVCRCICVYKTKIRCG